MINEANLYLDFKQAVIHNNGMRKSSAIGRRFKIILIAIVPLSYSWKSMISINDQRKIPR